MDKSSFFELTGVPQEFGVFLLTISVILVLTPYLEGQDLGLIKIPNIQSETGKKRLKIIGPFALLIALLLFLPIWPLDLFDNEVVDGRYDVEYRDPMIADTRNIVSLAIGTLPQFASIDPSSLTAFSIDHEIKRKQETDLIQPIPLKLASQQDNIKISEKMSAELIGFGGDGERMERTVNLEDSGNPTFWTWSVIAPNIAGVHSFIIRIYLGNSTEPINELAYEYEVVPYVQSAGIPTSTPTLTPSPSPIYISPATHRPTPISTSTHTPTSTPTPTSTSTSTPTPTPTLTPAPLLIVIGRDLRKIAPDDGTVVSSDLVSLSWDWGGELRENEFFEVRVWHESIPHHVAVGWVKVRRFDYNLSGLQDGKYYWTVVIVQGANPKRKDWTLQPSWPYPIWEGELVKVLSEEDTPRFFFYAP